MTDQPPQIHPLAYVEEPVTLGPGTAVWAFAHVMAGVKTGRHVSIGGHSEIGRGCVLGDYTRVGYGVFMPNNMIVGANVFIGPKVGFTDDKYPRVNNPHYRAEPAIIEDDVSIGLGAVILPGIRLGRGCLVGAGAIVTSDVPPHAVVMCKPARVYRRLEPIVL